MHVKPLGRSSRLTHRAAEACTSHSHWVGALAQKTIRSSLTLLASIGEVMTLLASMFRCDSEDAFMVQRSRCSLAGPRHSWSFGHCSGIGGIQAPAAVGAATFRQLELPTVPQIKGFFAGGLQKLETSVRNAPTLSSLRALPCIYPGEKKQRCSVLDQCSSTNDDDEEGMNGRRWRR